MWLSPNVLPAEFEIGGHYLGPEFSHTVSPFPTFRYPFPGHEWTSLHPSRYPSGVPTLYYIRILVLTIPTGNVSH